MKITVVTVTKNALCHLKETVQSVSLQSYHDIEHIVIDGASNDGTYQYLEKTSNIRWVSEPDGGIYDAMNKGIGLASGDVIGFLNSGDVFAHRNVLMRVADVMAQPDVDACYADLVYVAKEDTDKVVRYWKSRPYVRGLCRKGWMPAHPTFYVKRHLFDKYGVFDTRFKRQSDFELAFRLFERCEIRAVYVPDIWVKMRMGGISNNSFIGILKGNIEAVMACRKHGMNAGILFVLSKIARRIPQYLVRPW